VCVCGAWVVGTCGMFVRAQEKSTGSCLGTAGLVERHHLATAVGAPRKVGPQSLRAGLPAKLYRCLFVLQPDQCHKCRPTLDCPGTIGISTTSYDADRPAILFAPCVGLVLRLPRRLQSSRKPGRGRTLYGLAGLGLASAFTLAMRRVLVGGAVLTVVGAVVYAKRETLFPFLGGAPALYSGPSKVQAAGLLSVVSGYVRSWTLPTPLTQAWKGYGSLHPRFLLHE
jgi:hypothetical protein